jgi:transcriptional regulator with XRE-family HTH domain
VGTGLKLGQRIREIRLNKKLTQSDVVGDYMTRNMLSKIENGSAAPSVKTLEFLAGALDVPVSYFLEGGGREQVADISQLRVIDEIAVEMEHIPEVGGWARCVRARALMAACRTKEAMALFEGTGPEEWNDPNLAKHIFMILEDCHRERGDYKQAYEYALKRLSLRLDNSN